MERSLAFCFRSIWKWAWRHEEYVARRGYRHEFIFWQGLSRASECQQYENSCIGDVKSRLIRESVWGSDYCGAFCFLMYSICNFAALISEEQNWRKQIYENSNAYVGSGRTADGGDIRANHFFRPWNSGGTARRGHSVIALFESSMQH